LTADVSFQWLFLVVFGRDANVSPVTEVTLQVPLPAHNERVVGRFDAGLQANEINGLIHYQLIDQQVNRSFVHSFIHSVSQSVNQPANQSIIQ
jgi:hypothetical protein